jgi:FlaG/FlaF family flagellin (archaellin)
MVAITVILAAVIAAFVLGIGDTDDPAPSASLEYVADESNDELDIQHDSGDSFALGDAQINIDDGSTTTADGTTISDVVSEGEDAQFSPGDTIDIDDSGATTSAIGSGTDNTIEVELVWAPGGGDAQSVFSEDTLRNVDLALQSGNSNVN